MKDSGVEWIGEIPRGWTIMKIKRCCNKITDGSHVSPEKSDSGFPYVTVSNVYNDVIHLDECAKISLDDYTKLVSNGCKPLLRDVLLSKDGTVGRTAIVNTNVDFVILSSLAILSPDSDTNEKYLKYWLDSHSGQEQMLRIISGSALKRLTLEKINELIIVRPPLPKQQQIASYLDTKCSQIDTTIEKEREVIDKLKEYRQAVITESVTKGIRAGVPMKDSGVEWIGEIPINWKITSLKKIVDIRDGTHETPRYIDEGVDTYPLISSKDFVNGKIDYSECKWISFEDYKAICMRSKVELGDVLMSMIGGNIGKSIIVDDNPQFAIKNVALFKTELNKSLAILLYLYFSTTLLKTQIDLKSRGGAQDFLGLTDIRNLVWVFMEESEQQEIADYLDAKCSAIDATIQKRELAIEKLAAYKQSLIYECVTGKMVLA